MGWVDLEHPDHEGYAIGYVEREGCASSDSGLYRELCYPADDQDRRVVRIAAGCDCGWRSPRWVPDPATAWSPYSVHTAEADDERGRRLWRRHLELDVRGRVDRIATQPHRQAHIERVRIELRDLDGAARLLLSALRLYPKDPIASPRPRAFIFDVIEMIAPEVARALEDHSVDEVYQQMWPEQH